MADDKPHQTKPQKAQNREERLKSALKANMARRKAQARARADGQGPAGNAQNAQNKES